MSDDLYGFWRLALIHGNEKATKMLDLDLLDNEGLPMSGFYRSRRIGWREKGFTTPWRPVAIYQSYNQWIAEVGKYNITDEFDIYELWLKVSKNPVTEAAYRHAVEYNIWADDPPPVKKKPKPIDVSKQPPLI